MGTSFDIRRGSLSGRIRPASFRPVAGDYAFALGADAAVGAGDPMLPGDYVEVRQTLDLTDVDLVGATIDAVGRALDPFVGPGGWPLEPGTIFSFPFTEDAPTGQNEVVGGFNLPTADPTVEVGLETYSPDGRPCRQRPDQTPMPPWPDGIRGVLTPQPYPPSLPAYTFQCWLDFDADFFADSSNVPIVGRFGDGFGGLYVYLYGTFGPGAHTWRFSVLHGQGGFGAWYALPNFVIEHNRGWRLYSFVFDVALPVGQQLKLYEDTTLVDAHPNPVGVPVAPADGAPVLVMDAFYIGRLSRLRLLPVARSAAQVAADHLACVTPAVVTGRWTMAILVDGAPIVERTVAPTERRRWTDFAAPTRRYPGVHDVAFRLTLKEAA